MLHLRFKCIILEVFKFTQGTILACIQNVFQIKKPSYFMRDSSKTFQSKRNPTIFGLRSLSYFGRNLWNDLPSHLNESTDFITFKDQLPNWCGPDLSGLLNVYVYPLFNDFWTVAFLNIYQRLLCTYIHLSRTQVCCIYIYNLFFRMRCRYLHLVVQTLALC